MNIIIQNILVFLAFAIAVGFLIKKFFWKSSWSSAKKNNKEGCGDEGCGCR